MSSKLPFLSRLGSCRSARYLAIGACCALAHNLVMIFGDWLGGHYLTLVLVSYALIMPLAYWLHTSFTFNETRELRSFVRFAAGVATGFPLSLLTIAVFSSGLGLPMIVAAPMSTIVLFFWNYCSAHWAILKGWRLRIALDRTAKALGLVR